MSYQKLTLGIVTPSYNQGVFIDRTIYSVLSQKIDNLSYWVIDGASTDNTVEILSRYQEKGVQFISEPDKGQGHAVNKGITLLNTDIIGWLNADDIYLPDTFRKVLNYFSTHPECDVLFANAYHIDEQDHIVNTYRTGKWNLKQLQRRCTISQPTVFFRKSSWQRIGKINEDLYYCLDYEYWIRVAKMGATICFLNDFLAATRLHAHTKTSGGGVSSRIEAMNMLCMQYGAIHPIWYFAYARSCVMDTMPGAMTPKKIARILNSAIKEAIKREGKMKGLSRLFSLGLFSLLAEIVSRAIHVIRDNHRRYNRAL